MCYLQNSLACFQNGTYMQMQQKKFHKIWSQRGRGLTSRWSFVRGFSVLATQCWPIASMCNLHYSPACFQNDGLSVFLTAIKKWFQPASFKRMHNGPVNSQASWTLALPIYCVCVLSTSHIKCTVDLRYSFEFILTMKPTSRMSTMTSSNRLR